MTTLASTMQEFKNGVAEFHQQITNRSNTANGIANMHKGLCLLYIGLQDATGSEAESAAVMLQAATSSAIRRGWDLEAGIPGDCQ